MNVGFLGNDWSEFEQLYPSAYSWLLSRSLQREKEILTAEMARVEGFVADYTAKYGRLPHDDRRTTWVRTRLDELKHVRPVT